MKKILFCLIAILSMSCTCNSDTHKPDTPDVSPIGYASVIEVVEIEGHLYILYDEGGYGSGICHAEHCPCRNNNLK